MENERIIIDFDFDDITIRDKAGYDVDEETVDHGDVKFDVPSSFVEQIVQVAKRYAAMREETSGVEATWGAPITDGDKVIGHVDGVPTYRFTTRPCFSNLDTVFIDGMPANLDNDWTDVVIWDNGNGISFVNANDDGIEIVFGSNITDLENLLKLSKANAAAPGAPR